MDDGKGDDENDKFQVLIVSSYAHPYSARKKIRSKLSQKSFESVRSITYLT